uniref:Uncharacterized protein n=1 Tax=Panagrolaimus sp. ES5 TaxID=591445 RepID=A0AC34F4N5_9BILA
MESTSSSIMDEIRKENLFSLLSAGGRLATFKNWAFDKKKTAVCTSFNLAKAGFVYAGPKCTTCPFTGKVLEWEDEAEDPFVEHRGHCQNCDFVALMDKEESEWTLEDSIPLLASLATQTKLKQLFNWKEECERNYSKIEGRLTPFIPKNSAGTEDETNDEEEK